MGFNMKELKAELAKYSDDTLVLVEGYEGGFQT